MRKLKFRGMNIKGEWHYGNLSVLTQKVNNVEAGYYISNSVGLPFAYQVRPKTVGQFTGLKNKNGKEIYEGDIAYMYLKNRAIMWEEDKYSINKEEARLIEIIGNIYENPDLLEKK